MDSISSKIFSILSANFKNIRFLGVSGEVFIKPSEAYLFVDARVVYGILAREMGDELTDAWAAILSGEVRNINPEPVVLGDDYYLRWTASEHWWYPSNFRAGRVIGPLEMKTGFSHHALDNPVEISEEDKAKWERAVEKSLPKAHMKVVQDNKDLGLRKVLLGELLEILSIEDIKAVLEAGFDGKPMPFEIRKIGDVNENKLF